LLSVYLWEKLLKHLQTLRLDIAEVDKSTGKEVFCDVSHLMFD